MQKWYNFNIKFQLEMSFNHTSTETWKLFQGDSSLLCAAQYAVNNAAQTVPTDDLRSAQ